MSRNQRITLLGLAVVVLVVAFIVARSGSSEDEGGTRSSTTPTASTPAATTTTEDREVAGDGHRRRPARPSVATVVVRGGKPVGGVRRLSFRKGERIAFNVRSDVADEVHFHVYDIAREVTAGGTVRFRAQAKIEGRFEVELEGSHVQIAQLEVRP